MQERPPIVPWTLVAWMVAVAVSLALFASFAHAQAPSAGSLLNAPGTVGASAVNWSVCGASGAQGAPACFNFLPKSYVQFCNDSAIGGNNVGINPTGTASIGTAGTHTLFPGGCQTFETYAIPTNTWSVIAGGASTPVTVWYR